MTTLTARTGSLIAAISMLGVTGCAPRSTGILTRPPGDVSVERLLAADTEPGEWLTGGQDWRHSYYSPLATIDRQNVARLGYAWSLDLNNNRNLQATPIVVNDRAVRKYVAGRAMAPLEPVPLSLPDGYTPPTRAEIENILAAGSDSDRVAVKSLRVVLCASAKDEDHSESGLHD